MTHDKMTREHAPAVRRRLEADHAAWLLVAGVGAGACGLAVSTHSLVIAAAIPAVALGATVIPLLSAGAFVALALVLASNAVPGLDLTRLSAGEVNGTDLAFLALLGFAVVRRFSATTAAGSRRLGGLLLGLWSVCFLAVWSIAFVRALDAGTDYVHALSTGRDFLYFGLTLPFASHLLRNDEEMRHFCITLGTMSAIFAASYIAASLGLAPSAIANARHAASDGSLTRIYDAGYYLLALAFSFSFAYALLSKGRRSRAACLVAALTVSALALSLTRALYIGVVLAVILSLAVWGIGQGSAHRLLRRRLLATASVVVVLGAALAAAPGVLTGGPIQSVIARASSTTSALASSDISTSTLAYRANVDSLMAKTLGAQWPLGLGFLSPHTNYFADLPHGSIRNSDVGVFNSLMTVGLIGTMLLYLVPVWLLFALLSRAHWRIQRDSFLWMGGMIWLFIVLITSYSLGSLASVSGLATSAVGIGILLSRLEQSSDTHG